MKLNRWQKRSYIRWLEERIEHVKIRHIKELEPLLELKRNIEDDSERKD